LVANTPSPPMAITEVALPSCPRPFPYQTTPSTSFTATSPFKSVAGAPALPETRRFNLRRFAMIHSLKILSIDHDVAFGAVPPLAV
jgi:hypothetical protein